MTLWNGALTEAEILTLSQYGVGDPRSSDLSITSATLVSWWAFESNLHKTFFATPDNATTIFDRIASNNFTKQAGTYAFVDGFNLAKCFLMETTSSNCRHWKKLSYRVRPIR